MSGCQGAKLTNDGKRGLEPRSQGIGQSAR